MRKKGNLVIENLKKYKNDPWNDNSKLIEIREVDNNYIFGTFGKLENYKNGSLERVRDKENKKIHNPDSLIKDISLEKYSYFYLDFNTLQCAVLKNNDAPSFNSLFPKFIMSNNNTMYLDKVIVIPYVDNTKAALNKFTSIDNMYYVIATANNDALKRHTPSLSSAFVAAQTPINKLKISIDMKRTSFSAKELQNISDGKWSEEFESFKIKGLDEHEGKIVYDLISGVFNKTVEINIDKESLTNEDKADIIKEKLIGSLGSI